MLENTAKKILVGSAIWGLCVIALVVILPIIIAGTLENLGVPYSDGIVVKVSAVIAGTGTLIVMKMAYSDEERWSSVELSNATPVIVLAHCCLFAIPKFSSDVSYVVFLVLAGFGALLFYAWGLGLVSSAFKNLDNQKAQW